MHTNSKRFIAHIRAADKQEQYVDEHNDHVADLAAAVAQGYGLANIAKLAGRHHDDGKNTPEFAAYIWAAAEGKKLSAVRLFIPLTALCWSTNWLPQS